MEDRATPAGASSTYDHEASSRGISPNAVYPILLTRLQEAPVVVVGGGQVGERKVAGLLAVGAAVQLISPEATPQLQTWAEAGRLRWEKRGYQSGDLDGASLVFAATNRREVNSQVARDAARLGLLCNVADQPDEGNFFLPAVYRHDDLVIAVSTAGKSPAKARQLRDRLAEWLAGQVDLSD
jgi:cobalt-precorrin 5A hydrolase/precorrin-3B C17-methyltransferase